MKHTEFLRWLVAQGVEVKQGSNHLKLYYQGRRSTMPRHPNKELAKGTMIAIRKQLNL